MLVQGTKPNGLNVKTYDLVGRRVVYLGDYEIAMKDFCAMVRYVLTNTDLVGNNDPRLGLVNWVRELTKLPSWADMRFDFANPSGIRRLGLPNARQRYMKDKIAKMRRKQPRAK